MAILDQSQTNHDSSGAGLNTYWNRLFGQSFTAGIDGDLTQIKVWFFKQGTNGFTLTMKLYLADGSDEPTGSVLASESIADINVNDNAESTFVFSSPYTITTGVKYFIQFEDDSNSLTDYYSSYFATGNLYASGKAGYKEIGWAMSSDNDIYFKTYVETGATSWVDINTDIRVLNQPLLDINGDIRVVSEKESLRDINNDIRTAQRLFYDTNCDIRASVDYDKEYDIPLDIRVMTSPFSDINCDIRATQEGGEFPGFLPDIDCDIRVFSRNIYNINTDIRVQEDKTSIYDINTDIRVIPAPPVGVPLPSPGEYKIAPKSVGLSGFRVYLDSVEIEDVALDSIEWVWTFNESPASASFRIVRKSDNFNKTLEDVTQAINTNTPIEIKFDGNLRYYGYIMDISVENMGESVVVNCLDRKQKIQDKLYSGSYGRKWEFPEQGQLDVVEGDYPTTGEAITYLLDTLVSDGVISSYSGVPDGVISEYESIQDMPAGSLLTELLDLSGNYYWNVTPNGKLEIYEGGIGTIKLLPVQELNKQLFLYDIINYNFKVNDRNNLITSLEVTMGTESEEERASYRNVNAGTPLGDWASIPQFFDTYSYTQNYATVHGGVVDALNRAQLFKKNYPEKAKEIGTKFRISNWTDGSFIDDTFKPKVLVYKKASWIVVNVIWKEAGWEEIRGWSWGGKYLNLTNPILEVKRFTSFSIPDPLVPSWSVRIEHKIITPSLIGRFFRKESVIVAEIPSIFDVEWIGIGGAGSKRKVTFSHLGVRDNIAWTAFEENRLVAKSEPGYDDTEYATDRANLVLAKINDPITAGDINLTFDAFEYYGLNIGGRVNLSGTNETNIYNNNNGFPLDIMSIHFNAGSYIVTLDVSHVRNFKATKNYR